MRDSTWKKGQGKKGESTVRFDQSGRCSRRFTSFLVGSKTTLCPTVEFTIAFGEYLPRYICCPGGRLRFRSFRANRTRNTSLCIELLQRVQQSSAAFEALFGSSSGGSFVTSCLFTASALFRGVFLLVFNLILSLPLSSKFHQKSKYPKGSNAMIVAKFYRAVIVFLREAYYMRL